MSKSAPLKELATTLKGAKHSKLTVNVDGRDVTLTNLKKLFWPDLKITKGELLAYYVEVSKWLLPHLINRAMVMKRYPNGAYGEFFFMKRAPSPRPNWIKTCSIEHPSAGNIAFPVVQDLSTLLWIINLGCIDLNPWYARCDDINRPDYMHFDLDPVPKANFDKVQEAALLVLEALNKLKMKPLIKTSGSKGIHIYVPIVRGPLQKEVWTVAKEIAWTLAGEYPKTLTAEYRIAKRPPGRVLIDYNQNAWGRTLASVYSVRPKPKASVSAPISIKELERGVSIEDFTIKNMYERLNKVGDLWLPLLKKSGRFKLEALLEVN